MDGPRQNMVRLLMLTSSIAGGVGRVISDLNLNLDPNIHQRIVTLTSEILFPSNVPPISMNFNLKDSGIANLVYSVFLGIIKYRKVVKNYKPDVSLSFLYLDNFINILSNIGNKNTKVIISVHGALSSARVDAYFIFLSKSIVDKCFKFFINILYNKADLVIAVSEGVRNELVQVFNIKPDKVRLLYNPIDIEKIQRLANDEVIDEWFDVMPILINMGRLAQPKGQWHLIRAFSKVLKMKECKLAICGEGELSPYLEKLVRDLSLKNYVNFLGRQSNPFKYISKASIFVFPSLREGFPLALIESMICGCPVISTDCKYGPAEILRDGKFGVLVPPMDGKFYKGLSPLTPEEHLLADEIVKLLEDDNLRLMYSKNGIERARDFDLNRSINEYEKIIRE